MKRNVYFWHDRPNFGDTLAHTLLNTLGIEHERSKPEIADLIVTGSILEHMPSGWHGTIAGAGKLRESSDVRIRLRNADIKAIRGPLSAKGIRGDFALGDPGLLASLVVNPRPATHDLGIVRHWSDDKITRRFAYGWVIDPGRGAKAVIEDIASCRRIISSSLHGIIVADALGIPRQAEPFDSTFKWFDYAAALGEDPQFGKLTMPNQNAIERRQGELLDVLRSLA